MQYFRRSRYYKYDTQNKCKPLESGTLDIPSHLLKMVLTNQIQVSVWAANQTPPLKNIPALQPLSNCDLTVFKSMCHYVSLILLSSYSSSCNCCAHAAWNLHVMHCRGGIDHDAGLPSTVRCRMRHGTNESFDAGCISSHHGNIPEILIPETEGLSWRFSFSNCHSDWISQKRLSTGLPSLAGLQENRSTKLENERWRLLCQHAESWIHVDSWFLSAPWFDVHACSVSSVFYDRGYDLFLTPFGNGACRRSAPNLIFCRTSKKEKYKIANLRYQYIVLDITGYTSASTEQRSSQRYAEAFTREALDACQLIHHLWMTWQTHRLSA